MNKYPAKLDSIPEIEREIEETLTARKIKRKAVLSTKLIAEETLSSVINGGYAESDIAVQFHKTAWKTDLNIRFKGPEFEISPEHTGLEVSDGNDEMEQAFISNLILKSYSEKISTRYRNGINTITISADVSAQKNVIFCIYAILIASVIGVALRFLAPETVLTGINSYVLTPVTTMIMNVLKMLMVPIIFFSIASSMGMFKDIRDFGRMGIKTFSFYLFTTVVAVIVGFSAFTLMDPVETGALTYLNNDPITDVSKFSLISTIVNIVPNNFIASFYNADTLQIIFLAILTGICAMKTRKNSEKLTNGLASLNELFLRIAELTVKTLPLVVFTSICSMIITMDMQSITNLGTLMLLTLITTVAMNLFYLIVSSIKTRKPIIEIFKKAGPAWLNAFSLSSSNAAIPYSMDVCKKNLGVSPKVFSFSIPLGATINMDGGTILLTFSGLFLIKGFGLTMNPGDYVSFFAIIIMLAMGAPGIPGAGFMTLTILCQQFNVPASGVALLTPLLMITDPIITANNVMGDICGTICVAKSEKLIDE